MRAPFQAAELSATARGSSAGSTRFGTSDRRVGQSKEPMTPPMKAIAMTCQTSIRFRPSSSASATITAARLPWVMASIARRLTRSTTTPATGETSSTGRVVKKPTSPSIHGEPVRR